jgi:hypothetical protein
MARKICRFLLVVTGVLLALGADARADNVDRLINQLRGSSSYKVRLSAALTLTKLGDPRAIDPLARALRDQEKTVRGVAAAGLGKLVTADTPTRQRTQVLAALRRVARSDGNSVVRRQAEKAYNKVESLVDGSPAGGRVFVDVGGMGDKTRKNPALKNLMRQTVANTFKKRASGMRIGGEGPPPSRTQLRNMSAFHLDGTLTALSVSESGRSAEVSCKVSMLIATYPEKSMFGFLNGGARVSTGSSSRDIELGKKDCVAAVMEDLVARKVIPTLESRSR